MTYAVIVQFMRGERVRYTAAICVHSFTVEGIENEFRNTFYGLPISDSYRRGDVCWVTVFSLVGEFVLEFQL